ncbi:hypothetical protein L3V83_13820 [Thiotrichales bacterium 19X7-9]|nr:hypothetical protein [Thiotrichales bacterium 19X7-9]
MTTALNEHIKEPNCKELEIRLTIELKNAATLKQARTAGKFIGNIIKNIGNIFAFLPRAFSDCWGYRTDGASKLKSVKQATSIFYNQDKSALHYLSSTPSK